MITIKQNTYKGTRILFGNEKRNFINSCINILEQNGFEEISIPIIQPQAMFNGKVGEENNNMMFNFTDRGNRELCLAPEYTAVIQNLAKTVWKQEKNLRTFYVQECFRGENPQRGRFRQFTQLGVEIINPTEDYLPSLIELAHEMCAIEDFRVDFKITTNVKRGLDYYKNGQGFEIHYKDMQIVGGGEYDGGIGFAIGVDRLLTLSDEKSN